MPLQQTTGNSTADGFGGAAAGAAVVPNYIEDVFSTYLYTGNGSSQTITNNIDLSTKGGMVWAKRRDSAINHGLWSTTSAGNFLISNATTANTALATGVTAFSTTGFSLGSGYFNTNAGTYASWSFKQQAKFFTQVTYTGTGSTRTIAHDLGSTPAFIIVKRTDTTSNWACYHTSLGATQNIALNSTAAAASSSYWDNTSPTSTVFTVGGSFSDVNASGGTYIAYLFAHDAGGFGLTGTDNVITCGSYTGNGTSLQSINLGYEPQLVLIKSASIAGTEWAMLDNMRGVATGGVDAVLNPNTSGAEASPYDRVDFTSTGFNLKTSSSIYNETGTYIYIAIRRGPMKVPTSGTSVFDPVASNASTGTKLTTGFPVDLQIGKYRDGAAAITAVDRLRGVSTTSTELAYGLVTSSTAAEDTSNTRSLAWDNTGFQMPSWLGSIPDIFWNFRRAPSFFDEVCYTGTGANTTFAHNLGVAPELMIAKQRGASGTGWIVYHKDVGATKYLNLNTTAASATLTTVWNSTAPTSSVFSVGTNTSGNASGGTYVNYLFATCAGVSKVGSYTGTGATKQVDCGFAAGARFVLIKRTDSTGDWYVWDSARGIVSGNDPYLLLNSTAAEVTTTDYIDTYSAGFEISSTAPAAINASGGTFIFLAIA